jgi:hypothetical protein
MRSSEHSNEELCGGSLPQMAQLSRVNSIQMDDVLTDVVTDDVRPSQLRSETKPGHPSEERTTKYDRLTRGK